MTMDAYTMGGLVGAALATTNLIAYLGEKNYLRRGLDTPEALKSRMGTPFIRNPLADIGFRLALANYSKK